MATISNIVTRSLRRIRVLNPRETAGGQELTDGIAAFNEVMHGLKSKGIDTGHDTAVAADDFPLGEEFEGGVVALLASRLASDYGVAVPPEVGEEAFDVLTSLRAEFQTTEAVKFERGVVWGTIGRWGRSRDLS